MRDRRTAVLTSCATPANVRVIVTVHPLAPIQELDSRTLDRQLAKEKELYVDFPQKDDGDVFKTLIAMPKWRRDYQRSKKSLFSIFPRSQQYELCHIRDKRLKDLENRRRIAIERAEEEEKRELSDEPCDSRKPSSLWKDKPEKPSSLPLGNINDYAFEKFRDFDLQDAKLSEKLQMDHPKKYIPGVIHRLENPEDTSMTDALERADAFKVVSSREEPLSKSPPVEERVCHSDEHPRVLLARCELKADHDVEYGDKKILNADSRWYPFYDDISLPKTDLQRQKELRELTKPFLHDLHTWYSKNKPTKLIIPLRQPGKKAMPEMRFSHL
ncbi:unnamed protein product [Xylocopa violacea]|uniref:Uncharacterized protein n=1 Tax=Xylocopa violacea TaxID=135666 RepID=A0ABP1N5I5_XYLVO